MPLPLNTEFELKPGHVELIRNLNFGARAYWEDGCPMSVEFAPEINQKRPFGNSGVVYDAADRLGLLEDAPGGDRALSPAAERIAMKYLIELPVALEAAVSNGTFEPGIYAVNRCGAYFSYRSHLCCWFWLDAIRECAVLADGHNDGLMGRALEFCRSFPGWNPYAVLGQLRQWSAGQEKGAPIAAMYRAFRARAVEKYARSHPEAKDWDPEAVAAILITNGDPADTDWPFWREKEAD